MWSGESRRVFILDRVKIIKVFFFRTVLRRLQASAAVWELSRSSVMWILCESDTTVSGKERVQEQFCALVHCRERNSAVLWWCDDFLFLTTYFYFTQNQRMMPLNTGHERRTFGAGEISSARLTFLSQSTCSAQITEINTGACSPLFCVSKGANETSASGGVWRWWTFTSEVCVWPLRRATDQKPAPPTFNTVRRHSPAFVFMSYHQSDC